MKSKRKLTKIEEKQESAAYWAERVLEGTCSGLALVGPGGLGKTFAVEQLLERQGVNYEEKGRNSHITPLALYQTLYAYRDEPVLLLDDIEHIYKQEVSVGILRSALWGKKLQTGRRRRIVTYSSSRDIKVPGHFEYKGGLIIIGNKIPRKEDPIVEALLTRIVCVEFAVEPSDVYAFMRQVMVRREGYPIWNGQKQQQVWIPRRDCEKVIDELEARKITDLRKLEHALIAWVDFKRKPDRLNRELDNLASSSAKLDRVLRQSPKQRAYAMFLEIAKDNTIAENEKAKLFEERTRGLRPGRESGYNRATYFRWKQKWAVAELE